MATKRRADNLDEPQRKRNRLRVSDEVTVIYDAERGFVDEFNCSDDEKQVICEIPVYEDDDVDPLGPRAEDKDELKKELNEAAAKRDDNECKIKISIEETGIHGTRPQDRQKDYIHQGLRVLEPILEVNVPLSPPNRLPQLVERDPYTGMESEIEQPRSLSQTSRESTSKQSQEDSSLFTQLLSESNSPMKGRTVEQEREFIRSGRPMPSLRPPTFAHPKNRFWAGPKEYKRIPWLTGCRNQMNHYCWPCLLFSRERWFLMSGTTEDVFWRAIKLHEQSGIHKVASKYLQLRQAELRVKEEKIVDPQPKKQVKMNRTLMMLLIRILCAKRTRLHNLDSDYNGYEELMKVAISYDEDINEWMRSQPNGSLRDFVSRHAEKVYTSINDKISAKVLEEIANTPFASIIYEDTKSVVDRETQVSVIVRYVTAGGDICERFVKFVKLGPSRNAYDTAQLHCGVVEELGIQRRIVGITFSGTVVAPGSIEEFNNLIRKVSPKANFFNHPDHNLNEILLQSLSHLQECRNFLEAMSDLVKFFTTDGAIRTLIEVIKFRDPSCKLTPLGNRFTVGIISTIRQYHPHILEFFLRVSKKFRDDEVAMQAAIFIKFLKDPFNRFLIVVIASILDKIGSLSQLMEKEFSLMERKAEAVRVLEKLTLLRLNGPKYFPQLTAEMNENKKKSCSETLSKIVDLSIDCVRYRIQNLYVFSYDSPCATLSDVLQAPQIWGLYGKKLSLKDSKDLMGFVTLHKALFKDKSMADIVKTVCQMKLPKNFIEWPEFLRFCALTVLPAKSTLSAPSTVLRLKSYLKNKESFNTADTMMFLEEGRIRTLVRTPKFIDDVINHYATANNQPNFLETDVPLKVGTLDK